MPAAFRSRRLPKMLCSFVSTAINVQLEANPAELLTVCISAVGSWCGPWLSTLRTCILGMCKVYRPSQMLAGIHLARVHTALQAASPSLLPDIMPSKIRSSMPICWVEDTHVRLLPNIYTFVDILIIVRLILVILAYCMYNVSI